MMRRVSLHPKPVKILASHDPQSGFTLIELLLYTALVGTLLTAVSMFFALTTDARVKNRSISEVEQQGTAIMEQITQTIRSATGITAPATGASGTSLSLTVPTGSLSPTVFDLSSTGTVMGYNADGGSTDSGDANFMNATKFTATATGNITSLFAFIGPTVGASPNNKAQMGIYSGTASPTTLLASSSEVTLTANAWNTFTIPSTSVTSGQTYWLAYNTNGATAAQNNLRYHTGATNQTMYRAQTYGTWPSTWSGGTYSNFEDSMYALISTGGTVGTMQIKEGSGAIVPLTNGKVEVSGLTFKNLSRASTPGVIQISFTVSRVNPSGKDAYSYQKTFTGTAALQW